ncbi:MAG: hypothetical protein AAFR16_10425 [Pseudomonadota bacterium]
MSLDSRRMAMLLAASLALAGLNGCATPTGAGAEDPDQTAAAAAPAAEEPRWLVGYVWSPMDDGPVLMATRRTLEECALPRAAGLSGARIEDAPRGLQVVGPDGAEKIALEIETPANEPQARELKLRWAPGVGPEGRTAVLVGAQKVLRGEPPCPAAAG